MLRILTICRLFEISKMLKAESRERRFRRVLTATVRSTVTRPRNLRALGRHHPLYIPEGLAES